MNYLSHLSLRDLQYCVYIHATALSNRGGKEAFQAVPKAVIRALSVMQALTVVSDNWVVLTVQRSFAAGLAL